MSNGRLGQGYWSAATRSGAIASGATVTEVPCVGGLGLGLLIQGQGLTGSWPTVTEATACWWTGSDLGLLGLGLLGLGLLGLGLLGLGLL